MRRIMAKNIMEYDTVALSEEENAVVIIDQTKLPGKIELISLKTAQDLGCDLPVAGEGCSGNRSYRRHGDLCADKSAGNG